MAVSGWPWDMCPFKVPCGRQVALRADAVRRPLTLPKATWHLLAVDC
jgi:hypothetical protein